MLRTIVAAALLLFWAGCESSECSQMQRCCEEVAGEEWVGDACGAITESVNNAKACAAVTDAIKVAAEQRNQKVPAVCQ